MCSSDLAESLETAFVNQEEKAISGFVADFQDQLETILNSIAGIREENGCVEEDSGNFAIGDREMLYQLMDELEPLLESRKPVPSKMIMAKISQYTWSTGLAENIGQLGKLVGKYKFEEARTLIKDIRDKI